MMKNLPTYAGGALKTKPAVAAFLRTKADGIYGGKTKGLIGYLKIGLTDPKYPDNDDTTIKADFVNRMLKEFKVITENKTYIGLDGRTLIIEGFDTGAADVASGVSSGGNRGSGGTAVKKEVETKVDSKAEFLQGKDDYSYFLKDNVWYSKKGNGPLQILLNPDSIKKLIAKAGGNYIKIVNTNGVPARADKHIYKLENKEWKVSLNGVGSWEKVNDPKELIATYGTGGSASGTKTSSETMASYARRLVLAMEGGGTIMDEILSVYRKIKTRADLVALHAAFKKDGRNQGINLTYWLKGDFDVDEWKSLFKVLTANNLLDKEAKLELQYGTGNFMIFFNTYLNNYKRAAAGKK
jgi:hypothetical protein